jgi:hypothetical protein
MRFTRWWRIRSKDQEARSKKELGRGRRNRKRKIPRDEENQDKRFSSSFGTMWKIRF